MTKFFRKYYIELIRCAIIDNRIKKIRDFVSAKKKTVFLHYVISIISYKYYNKS